MTLPTRSLCAAAWLLAFTPLLPGQEPEKITQPGAISGTTTITFGSRTNLNEKGKPQKGAKDVYEVNLSVAKTTEFKGKIERYPLIVSDLLGRTEQPAQIVFSLDLGVVNPADMTQKKTVGKWVGTVPINTNGVYELGGTGDSKHRISIDAIGRAPAFTENFSGNLYGKGKKTGGVMSYVRQIQGKEVKLEIKNSDPLRFENVTLATGPAQSYPRTTVNGNLDYDYETGNWLTNGLKFHYTLNGKEYDDVVTGSIKWVEDPNRASNGKGQYEFNLRFNEGKSKPATTEADAFTNLSDEEAFFAVDNSVPSLTGTIKYEDTFTSISGEPVPSASKITYQLDANMLTKQQIMNFLKLWIIATGPANDE